MTPLNSEPFSVSRAVCAVFISWFLAQTIKVLRNLARAKYRKFNFRWIFDTGGMPSSHSSSVAALSTTVGLYYGFWTMPFLITVIFTIIIMFDAAGVRRSVGRQATILNKMMDDIYEKGQVADVRVKELFGHTPVEVFAGAFLGIVLSWVICSL